MYLAVKAKICSYIALGEYFDNWVVSTLEFMITIIPMPIQSTLTSKTYVLAVVQFWSIHLKLFECPLVYSMKNILTINHRGRSLYGIYCKCKEVIFWRENFKIYDIFICKIMLRLGKIVKFYTFEIQPLHSTVYNNYDTISPKYCMQYKYINAAQHA